ncbi:hypothetical protein GCM10009814_04730 [Lapillicoccus jejuensis]
MQTVEPLLVAISWTATWPALPPPAGISTRRVICEGWQVVVVADPPVVVVVPGASAPPLAVVVVPEPDPASAEVVVLAGGSVLVTVVVTGACAPVWVVPSLVLQAPRAPAASRAEPRARVARVVVRRVVGRCAVPITRPFEVWFVG